MTAVTLRRGPDPDLFRVDHYGARWYRDPLPACDIAPATNDKWPSVSTIKKAWSKPFRKKLPDGSRTVPLDAYWAAEFVVNNLPAVNALAGDPAAAIALICDAGGRTLNRAAQRGTATHEILETLAAGQDVHEVDVPDDARPYIPACRAFIADWSPRFLFTEVVAINRTLGFGGTFDCIAEFAGRRWIIDYKSRGGDHGCYEEEIAQLGGYSLAEYIVLDDGAGGAYRAPMPEVDGAMVVSLNADGYAAYPIDLDQAQAAFRSMHVSWREHRAGQKAARAARGKPMIPTRSPAVATHGASDGAGGGEGAASTVTDAPSPPAIAATVRTDDTPASPARIEWLRGRVAAITAAGHEPDLLARWDANMCPPPIGAGYTDEQVSMAASWCAAVEADHEMTWPAIDPLIAEAFPGAAPVDETPPAPRPDPWADAKMWADRAKALLDGFDEAEIVAIAAAAGMSKDDSRMNATRYRNLEAIVAQLGDPNGAVELAYDAYGPHVVPAADAAARMAEACTGGPDGKRLGRSAALARAKALAKDLGLPAPRSLVKAAEHPLLAALVAAGHGTPTTTTHNTKETTHGEVR